MAAVRARTDICADFLFLHGGSKLSQFGCAPYDEAAVRARTGRCAVFLFLRGRSTGKICRTPLQTGIGGSDGRVCRRRKICLPSVGEGLAPPENNGKIFVPSGQKITLYAVILEGATRLIESHRKI